MLLAAHHPASLLHPRMVLEVLKYLPLSSVPALASSWRRWATVVRDDKSWRILAPIHGVQDSRFLICLQGIRSGSTYAGLHFAAQHKPPIGGCDDQGAFIALDVRHRSAFTASHV